MVAMGPAFYFFAVSDRWLLYTGLSRKFWSGRTKTGSQNSQSAAVELDSVKSARKAKDKLHKACERTSETCERTCHK